MSGFEEREAHWYAGRRPSMRPPARIESRAALAVIALVIGFLVAVQATRGSDTNLSRLASERPEDLTRILADLGGEADELTSEVAELQEKLSRYRGSTRSDDLAVRDARKALADLQVLAGSVPVSGPGIRFTVEDAQRQVTWEQLLDLVQELRDAGAEAIAVGEVRVIASTWLGPAEAGVTVDGQVVRAPYEILAIGAGEEMAAALRIPGGPLTVIDAQGRVEVNLELEEDLRLPAAERIPSLEHAQPA